MAWLAFDIGSTGTKAALIDAQGHTLRSAYRAYETFAAEGGIVEQQVADWWQAVIESAHELNATEAEAIVLTGQMQDLILVNTQGDAIRPVILYSDTRSYQEADAINAQLGVDWLCQLTGNQQGAGGLLAKLVWLSRHEPYALSGSAHVLLGAADYMALKLTGAAATDSTTASTTGLLQMSTRQWFDPDVFQALGLAEVRRLLPQVVAGGTQIGVLSTEIATLLGLKAGIPVHLGPGDAGATTLGVGSGEAGQVYAYIGTSGWVAFTSAQRISQDTGVFTLAHPQPDQYIYIAPLLTAGGNLDWMRELFGAGNPAELISEALACPPTHLLYLPYLNGERSPFSDPFARGAFIGLSAQHTRADLCRAVLEGVLYAYRHALDALISEPITGLALTGGGTQSPEWCQLFADIVNLPVAVADDAAHVGVRGAVLAAQVWSGQHATYAIPSFFPAHQFLQPNSQHQAHYERQYPLFRAAYLALKPIFEGLALPPT